MAVVASPAPLFAQNTDWTTNTYYARSTAENIAESCKKLWTTGGGTLSGECNNATSDDHISAISTTFTLGSVIYCPEKLDGSQTVIAWGKKASDDVFVATSWQIGLSSDGKNYVVSAVCDHTGSGTTQDRSKLDLGDTTNGLKNDNGKFAER